MSKLTVLEIAKMKVDRIPIAMLTAYDATFARLIDAAGIDIVLVGDSLGMVIQGHETTIPVTVDDIIYHTRAVARAVKRAHLVADMPFGSYQASCEDGIRNASRLIKEGGAESVKVEGGRELTPFVRAATRAGIPVMGHLGLTPQSVHQLGGFHVQGRDDEAAARIVDDARALEDAGVYAIVLEAVPRALAERVTSAVHVPTIGIGAGPDCDGQVLVIYDLLGFNGRVKPKFVKRYDDFEHRTLDAVAAYMKEVKAKSFPSDEYSFH
ncbi:MAG: 3-methyl-2-oxobutanoate hydroxymethyltransferase [Deltaproteobacteria bacterium]|nr:3-methyl-2-oxobutanoate hydroxymethyltransferase [Deltaproteobacteria bacterium]